jgi:uncharacterized protein (TIGR02145 family)
MAQNLAFYKAKDCRIYENKSKNLSKFGYLYTWNAAQNICPAGWHLPTKEEFEILITNTGNNNDSAYFNLIHIGTTTFSARFGGYCNDQGDFFNMNRSAHFWSASTGDDIFGWGLDIDSDEKAAWMLSRNRFWGLSVRCLKND